MLEKKRNPFKYFGKVYKYEFIHASKTLLPMYIIIIILGLFIGLLQSPMSDYADNIAENEAQIESMTSSSGMLIYDVNGETQILQAKTNVMKTVIGAVLMFIFSIYTTVVFVITLFVLAKRFRKSMLGDEAYLNLVLPVTIGEHIWGRFLAAFTWLILCFITDGISILLCMIRNKAIRLFPEFINLIKDFDGFTTIGIKPGLFFTESFIMMILGCMSVILLVYCVNALGHLNQKNKTLIKFVSAIALIIFQSNLNKWILKPFGDNITVQTTIICGICCQLFMCTFYMTVTHLIFTKRLNLE